MVINSVRNNISALSSRKYLNEHNRDLYKTYDQISSGYRITHPKDDPAKFVTSEQLRTKISDINQVQKNTATAISMVQLAESGLNEINQLLVSMRQVAVHSANDAANDKYSLQANQTEIDNSIEEIDRILSNITFAEKPLYKTESGTISTSTDLIEVLASSEKTKSSGVDGYDLVISNWPSYSNIKFRREINSDDFDPVKGGLKFNFMVDNQSYEYTAKFDDQSASGDKLTADIVRGINQMFCDNNLPLIATLDSRNIITISQKKLGSDHSFSMAVNTDDLISNKAETLTDASLGADIQGMINGELFRGKGSIIMGKVGGRTEGLKLHYKIPYEINNSTTFDDKGQPTNLTPIDEEKELPYSVGKIFVKNNSLTYHTGTEQGELVKFHLPEINSSKLANFIENKSGFESLKDIKVTDFQSSQDSIVLLKEAINDITVLRGKIGAFQKDLLETNQQSLEGRLVDTNSADSEIRDMDMALASVNLAKQQLQQTTAIEAIQGANVRKNEILRLFRN